MIPPVPRRAFTAGLFSLPLSALASACADPSPSPNNDPNSPPPPTSDRGNQGPLPESALGTVLLANVPFVQQKPDFCGEACVEMGARLLGRTYDQDAVFALTYVDPTEGRGAYTQDLAAALKRLGYEIGPVWIKAPARDALPVLQAELAKVHAALTRGVPSILCMHYDDSPRTTEHFRLIVGYDAATDEVVYHEPAVDKGAYRRMSRAQLFNLWPLKYSAEEWTLIHMPLAPGRLIDVPVEVGFKRADYAQHIMSLKKKLSTLGLGHLSLRIEEPFVVAGDDPPDALARQSKTVRWAADHLEKDFFAERPTRILDVYLFKSAETYNTGVRKFTNEPPDTPYGFYSSELGGLFMNIATGGGTLVHEIVHPYVEADFPNAPAWLNEGLGSLFEQSNERGGHIIGMTNWRLAGLKRAIQKKRLPTFRELTAMSDDTFYNHDRGDNYAQSRYLFYYMQEQDRLISFYKAFRANRAKDPTGYATLVASLGESDMTAFEKTWQDYVMALTFP